MIFTNEIYHKYEKMVYAAANKTANIFHMQTEDLIGDGMEIFYLSIEKFDDTRGVAFSTYLYHQLRRLNDRAKQWTGHFYVCTSEIFEEVLEGIDFSKHNMELLDSIATELSSTAQLYLTDLFNGMYAEPVGAHRPTIYPRERIAAIYNISIYAVDKLREEIKNWWNAYPKEGVYREVEPCQIVSERRYGI